jgi:hypothetical protein
MVRSNERALRAHEALLTLRQPSRLFMLAAGKHMSVGQTRGEVLGELLGSNSVRVSEVYGPETTKSIREEEVDISSSMDTDAPIPYSPRHRYTPSSSSSIDESYDF